MKHSFIFILLSLLFVACSDSREPEFKNLENESLDTFQVHIRFQGKDYLSKAYEQNGSNVYENPEIIEILEQIEQIPTAVSVVNPDGTVEYFTNDSEMQKQHKFKILKSTDIESFQKEHPNFSNLISTRATDIANCTMYDDDNFKDTNYTMTLTSLFDIEEFAVLDYDYSNNPIGLNDKITSLLINYNISDPELCAILVVWEDTRFNYGDNDRTKHRTYFLANSTNPHARYANLKAYPCFNSRDSWNDRISSVSFHIGYSNSLPSNY